MEERFAFFVQLYAHLFFPFYFILSPFSANTMNLSLVTSVFTLPHSGERNDLSCQE